MTTYTLGVNCHMTLQHDLLNSGFPFGFILHNDSEDDRLGPAISVQKTVDSDGAVKTRAFFSVLLGDNLINPDGTKHDCDTRAQMYAMILNFLAKPDHITLICSAGVMTNLCSLGHVSTERHYSDHSLVVCQLTDISTYYPPADAVAYNLSKWDSVSLTWATSYWRNTISAPPIVVP